MNFVGQKKRYEVSGLMEWSIPVSAGGNSMRIEFTGGVTNGNGIQPARFETSNPIIQYAIETSPHFRSGRIKDATPASWKVAPAAPVVKAPKPEPAPVAAPAVEEVKPYIPPVEESPRLEEHLEITSLAQAAAFLKEKGLPASSFRTKELARNTAKENGYLFPNLI